jgi:hypothetical protein
MAAPDIGGIFMRPIILVLSVGCALLAIGSHQTSAQDIADTSSLVRSATEPPTTFTASKLVLKPLFVVQSSGGSASYFRRKAGLRTDLRRSLRPIRHLQRRRFSRSMMVSIFAFVQKPSGEMPCLRPI